MTNNSTKTVYPGFQHQTIKAKLRIGDRIPYFSLRATDEKIYSIDDFVGARALVIMFLSNYCPKCISYENKICSLVDHFSSYQVRFVGICSNDAESFPEDSFEKMVEKSKQLGFPFPYLQDESQSTARVFDAACTPEIYLFDADFKLQYHGCVDSMTGGSDVTEEVGLVPALNSLLRGELPKIQTTTCLGCSIKWKVRQSDPDKPWG